MFNLLLSFEAFYQLKQKAFPIFGVIFFLMGIMMSRQGFGPTNVDFNSGYQISYYSNMLTLMCVFVVMFFAISGVLRDQQFNMENLVNSTSIKKRHFFWSRFLGVFIFSLLGFSTFLIGSAFGFSVFDLDAERVAPFSAIPYLWIWLITIIPNVFICATLIFATSILTKNNTATYVSAVFVYMLYIICSIFLNSPLIAQAVPASPESMMIAALADPFGISAFFEQTQFWTSYQKNTELLSFSGLYMWNRLLWIGVSFGILTLTYRSFSFRQMNQKIKKEKQRNETVIEPKEYKAINPSNGTKSVLTTLLSLLKVELSGVIKSLPFMAINAIWLVIVLSEISLRIRGGAYDDSWYPFTNLLMKNIVAPLKLLSMVLIVFYSAEIVNREKSFNFSGIIDATPTSNSLFFISKYVALALLPMLLIASGIGMCILFQLGVGYYNLEIGQYLTTFYHSGLQLLVFSIGAIFIQSLFQNKYLGMGITLIVLLGTFLFPFIGIEYPLFRLGLLPTPTYTNMSGYTEGVKKFNHLALYWFGVSGVLSLLSFKLWQRGIITKVSFRITQLLSNWKKWELLTLGAFSVLFFASAAQFFYNNNVLNEYVTIAHKLDFNENYERKFKQYENLEKLYRVAIKTEVALFPNEQTYTVKGEYILKNKNDKSISKLFVTERVPVSSIHFENAKLIEKDSEFGVYIFEFQQPILPNQEVKYSYELTKRISGYENDKTIVPNGSYLMHRNFEPVLSYRSSFEIQDDFEREKRDLPKREEEITTDEHLTAYSVSTGRVDYETIISTQSDETAIGSGELVKKWKNKGRNYYHYKSAHKILPMMGYFSAKYAAKKVLHNGIMIEQYFHPEHNFNIDSIEESTKQALDYCIANFGNYTQKHVRIAEVPEHWSFGGFAHPGVISMTGHGLYLSDIKDPDKFNVVAKRVIHEVAHQWWGHLLTPKGTDGSLLVEGFAKYTEGTVMEKVYGKRAIFQLSENANSRYFNGRTFISELEPPLYRVMGENYLSHAKTFTVMLALRELLGEKTVNQVLKTLADRHRDEEELSAHSLEFLDELYKTSSASQQVLIDDWFKKVIVYDLSVENSASKKLENGKFEIAINVSSKRIQTLASGETEKININEPISIGLFSQHPSEIKDDSAIIYMKQHQINAEKMEIKIIVDQLPKFVSIDPFGTRNDANLGDNISEM